METKRGNSIIFAFDSKKKLVYNLRNYFSSIIYRGFKKSYLVLNIESFKNKEGVLEDPTYDYNKFLDHILGHQEMTMIRYKQDEDF